MNILTIDAGTPYDGTHLFKWEDVQAQLRIKKTETDQVVYKLAIEWERVGGVSTFQVSISDRNIQYKTKGFNWSTKIVVDVFGGIIRITEKDKHAKSTLYANPESKKLISMRPAFTAELSTITAPAGSMKALKQMGQRFVPDDGKIVTKVLYNEKFVILQAINLKDEFKPDIYIAKVGTESFVKGEVKNIEFTGGLFQCRLNVKLNDKTDILDLPVGCVEIDSETAWSGDKLKIHTINGRY